MTGNQQMQQIGVFYLTTLTTYYFDYFKKKRTWNEPRKSWRYGK
jgi:hypothetical protein